MSTLNKNKWSCKICGRTFSKKNQSHTCTTIKTDEHFKNKPYLLKELYSELTSQMLKQNEVIFDPISFTINMKTPRKNFGMLFVEKDSLKVEFFLPRKVIDPRVVKTANLKNIWTHIVYLKDKKEIDNQLLNWLKESYEFNS